MNDIEVIGGLMVWLGSLPFVIYMAIRSLIEALNQTDEYCDEVDTAGPVLVGLDERQAEDFTELDREWLALHQIEGWR